MSTATHLITYEESLTLPESNLEEVVDSKLLTLPLATRNHNAIVAMLHEIFLLQMSREFMAIERTGYLLQRNPLRYRIPDLAIVNRAVWKSDIRTTSGPYSHIVPQMVIEVAFPSNRKADLERLSSNYADFKIPEVLFFYLERRTFESYQGLTLIQSAQTGLVSPSTMPEVSIDLDLLWEEF